MKITALIENDSYKEGICAQYGLSLLVQTQAGAFVVDAGQNEEALKNFHVLGYSLDMIDAIVVSHNHFDHIGGLQSFVDATDLRKPPVYVSAGTGKELFTKTLFSRRNLCSRNDLIRQNADRVHFVDGCVGILPGVFVCTVDTPDPKFLCKDRKLRMLSPGGRLVPDDFRHEVYVAVLENDTLKIISSCSHTGIVNILRDAERRFGMPASVFVGGLHMRGKRSNTLNCSRSYVKNVLDELNTNGVCTIHTCHCTGKLGYKLIKQGFHGRTKYFSSGDRFEV